jgi:hypothetical protein
MCFRLTAFEIRHLMGQYAQMNESIINRCLLDNSRDKLQSFLKRESEETTPSLRGKREEFHQRLSPG